MNNAKPMTIHKIILAAWLAGAVLAAGCLGASRSLPTVEQLVEAGLAAEGEEFESLRRGRALAVTECGACHKFYWPSQFPPEEWPELIRDHEREVALNPAQMRYLELYYVTASRAAARE